MGACMGNPSTFGGRLKQLRQEHGLTQDMLAERVGYATQTIRKIEGGQRRPSYQIAAKLAEELGIAPEERASFMRLARSGTDDDPVDPPAATVLQPQLTSLPPLPDTLPTPLTRLIGREQEVSEIRQRLLQDDWRLLTLVGAGGAGKTRLAVEVAAGLVDHFDDGVAFVNLVPIHDPNLVVPTIADALGIGEEGGRPRLERLKAGLRARRLLLVIARQLVEQCEPHLWGGAQEQVLARLEQEHDNLRAALTWYTAYDDSIVPALEMAGCLWRFWDIHGHWTEGQRWIEQALRRGVGADPAHRWLALHGAGNLAFNLGEYARARAHYEESLAVTRSLALQKGVANSLLNLALVTFYQGDLRHAIELQEESLAIHCALNNNIGIALALQLLARLLRNAGDYERAAACADESLARYQDLQDRRGIAWALHERALLARRHGSYEQARELLEECQAIYLTLEAGTDLARALNDLGELAAEQAEYAAARMLYAESLELANQLGDRRRQAIVLANRAKLARHTGDEACAADLLNRSQALACELGQYAADG